MAAGRRLAVNVALARILRGLADSDQVQEPDKMATRRAAGTLANTTEEEASNLKRAAAAVRRAAPGYLTGRNYAAYERRVIDPPVAQLIERKRLTARTLIEPWSDGGGWGGSAKASYRRLAVRIA